MRLSNPGDPHDHLTYIKHNILFTCSPIHTFFTDAKNVYLVTLISFSRIRTLHAVITLVVRGSKTRPVKTPVVHIDQMIVESFVQVHYSVVQMQNKSV